METVVRRINKRTVASADTDAATSEHHTTISGLACEAVASPRILPACSSAHFPHSSSRSVLIGCGQRNDSPATRVAWTISRYRDLARAVRLTNGTAELICRPIDRRRIMRYGLIGGENILWENPTASDKNFGGDKAWPGRRATGSSLIGADWPPPDAYALTPCTVEQTRSALRAHHDLRPTRVSAFLSSARSAMSDHGTRVTLESRLVPEPAGGRPRRCSSPRGSVAQVPNADLLLARVADRSVEPAYRRCPRNRGSRPRRRASAREGLHASRARRKDAAKLGIDADILAWVKGSTFFMQRLPAASALPPTGRRARPGLSRGRLTARIHRDSNSPPPRRLRDRVLCVTWEHARPPARPAARPKRVATYIVPACDPDSFMRILLTTRRAVSIVSYAPARSAPSLAVTIALCCAARAVSRRSRSSIRTSACRPG
jgi:hypothetical protein